MLAPYRSVLSTPGATMFSTTGFVARLPISMVTLGIVLLIAGRTGSYGLAGGVSAAYMVATASSSPVLARLIDVWGQARILTPCVVGFGTGLGALVVSVEADWPLPLPHIFAVIAGLCFPPVGACVRARWSLALGKGARLNTAYALEAVVDEAIFIIGPVVVTLLATQVHETAGVVAVITLALVGGLWFASLHATEPPTQSVGVRRRDREPLGWRSLSPLILSSICLGSLFGAAEVVTVAFTSEQGHPRTAGLLLAIWSAGSLIAGIATGLIAWTSSPRRRYRLGAAGMACAMLPLPFIDSLWLMSVVLFLGGFAISPTLVATVSLVEGLVPASRLTEGITWVMTGIGLGVAPGAAIAGWLIDRFDASTAFTVPVVGGVLAAVIAALTPERRTAPTP